MSMTAVATNNLAVEQHAKTDLYVREEALTAMIRAIQRGDPAERVFDSGMKAALAALSYRYGKANDTADDRVLDAAHDLARSALPDAIDLVFGPGDGYIASLCTCYQQQPRRLDHQ